MNKHHSMFESFLEHSRSHETPYPVDLDYLGMKNFIVYPRVFSPKYDADSKFFPEALAALCKQGSLLEIGTGSGVVSIHCQRTNQIEVVATDINPLAVENCRENALKFNAPIDAREGNLFEPLEPDESFDFIFWNHPWYPRAEANDALEQAVYDHEYRYLDLYLRQASSFLNERGSLLLGTSELGDIEWIRTRAHEYGYECRTVSKMKYPARTDEGKFFLFELLLLEFIR